MQETQKTQVQFLGQKDPWRKKWQPIPVFLPGESHGQRSLAGYSPRGPEESGMTERLSTQKYKKKSLGVLSEIPTIAQIVILKRKSLC